MAVRKCIAAYGFSPQSHLAAAQRGMIGTIELSLRRDLPPVTTYSRTSPEPPTRSSARYSREQTWARRDVSPPVQPKQPSGKLPLANPATSTPVYHVTHVDNLPGILAEGGLLSHAALRQKGTDYVDISDSHIQAKRARKVIWCWEPCPTVDQFVPLAFRPCPLMLRQVALGADISYAGGVTPIVHLVFIAEDVHCAGIDYAISDRHPLSDLAQWAYNLEGMRNLLDWQLIQGPLLDKDDPRHSYQMAEFLVRDQVPWQLVREVAVMTDAVRSQVMEALKNAPQTLPITVRPEWYP